MSSIIYKVPANGRRVAPILLPSGDFGCPIMVTPGTPAARVKIFREIFLTAISDPEALVEAKKGRMDTRRPPEKILKRWSKNFSILCGKSSSARRNCLHNNIRRKDPAWRSCSGIRNRRKERKGRKRIEVAGGFETRYLRSRFLRAEQDNKIAANSLMAPGTVLSICVE